MEPKKQETERNNKKSGKIDERTTGYVVCALMLLAVIIGIITTPAIGIVFFIVLIFFIGLIFCESKPSREPFRNQSYQSRNSTSDAFFNRNPGSLALSNGRNHVR